MLTKFDIAQWFERGINKRATHLLVACDTFDYEYYPIFAFSEQEAREKYASKHGHNLQKIMEVYNLKKDKEKQLNTQNNFEY